MKVIANIRRQPGENEEPDESSTTVEGEADRYEDAKAIATSKVPDGWTILSYVVPEHHPD